MKAVSNAELVILPLSRVWSSRGTQNKENLANLPLDPYWQRWLRLCAWPGESVLRHLMPRHLSPAHCSALQPCVHPTVLPSSVVSLPLFLQLSVGVGTCPCKTEDKGQERSGHLRTSSWFLSCADGSSSTTFSCLLRSNPRGPQVERLHMGLWEQLMAAPWFLVPNWFSHKWHSPACRLHLWATALD